MKHINKKKKYFKMIMRVIKLVFISSHARFESLKFVFTNFFKTSPPPKIQIHGADNVYMD